MLVEGRTGLPTIHLNMLITVLHSETWQRSSRWNVAQSIAGKESESMHKRLHILFSIQHDMHYGRCFHMPVLSGNGEI